jgi:hypothetical protein
MSSSLICEKATFCIIETGELIISVDASMNLEDESIVLDATEVVDLKAWLSAARK